VGLVTKLAKKLEKAANMKRVDASKTARVPTPIPIFVGWLINFPMSPRSTE
jgi:hypothetical protein